MVLTRRNILAGIAACAASALPFANAFAQADYPSRPVRVVVPYAAGGGTDFFARLVFAEIGKQWWAVFPRYIADPTLGTHFGRARGPSLNSASLGVMLTVCFWAAWMLWPRLPRLQQAAVGVLMQAIVGGIYFTYTRSTWIGLSAGLAVIPLVQLPQWRTALVILILLVRPQGLIVTSAAKERV